MGLVGSMDPVGSDQLVAGSSGMVPAIHFTLPENFKLPKTKFWLL